MAESDGILSGLHAVVASRRGAESAEREAGNQHPNDGQGLTQW
jgi:hypothetical protein